MSIHEEIVENAFIKSYQLLYSKDKNLIFSNKSFDLSQKISSIEKTLEHLNLKEEQRGKIEKRLIKFKKALEQGEEQPDIVTFVFKTGHKTKGCTTFQRIYENI